jgi:phosphoribosylamine--glycine ligase
MARLVSDPLDLFAWICGSKTDRTEIQWSPNVATCVVIASDGYPEAPAKGDVITGLEFVSMVPDTVVFHAATRMNQKGELESVGGRTLSVVALSDTIDGARHSAYKAVDMIQLRGRRVRRDIGV